MKCVLKYIFQYGKSRSLKINLKNAETAETAEFQKGATLDTFKAFLWD